MDHFGSLMGRFGVECHLMTIISFDWGRECAVDMMFGGVEKGMVGGGEYLI